MRVVFILNDIIDHKKEREIMVSYASREFLSSQFQINNLQIDSFNQTYEGFDFEQDNLKYKHRRANKTPLKQGYFLAVWQKNPQNKNEPFRSDDDLDYLVISIMDDNRRGYFKFPKALLIQQHILTHNDKKGKMAFRVYPSWEHDLNHTATLTKKWQAPYFINMSPQ